MDKNMHHKLLAFSLYALLSCAALADPLCLSNETIVFSCGVGAKSISVCSANNDTVIYRFGTQQHLELELGSAVHFSRTAYSGGGEGHLTFSRGQYKYVVYSSISNGDWLADGMRDKIQQAGVYVIKNERVLADIQCKSFAGNNFIGPLPPHVEQEFQYYE